MSNRTPCPSCPDGNEWGANGPSGRVCKTCGGKAYMGADNCPECDSDDTIQAHGFAAGGVETNYQACCACNHQWDHQ